jgi:hypothetical protein
LYVSVLHLHLAFRWLITSLICLLMADNCSSPDILYTTHAYPFVLSLAPT